MSCHRPEFREMFSEIWGGSAKPPKFREIWGVGAQCDNVRIFAQYFAFDPHPSRRRLARVSIHPSFTRTNQPTKPDEPDETNNGARTGDVRMADGRGSGALRQTIGNTSPLFMPVVKVLSEPSIRRPSPVRRAVLLMRPGQGVCRLSCILQNSLTPWL